MVLVSARVFGADRVVVSDLDRGKLDIARSQDSEARRSRPPARLRPRPRSRRRSRGAAPRQVGDGTTTVVLLAGEFLREAKPFIEDGVHPQLIIKAFRTAATLGVEAVRSMSVRCACRPRSRAPAAGCAAAARLRRRSPVP
jgi:hypothetical protein